MLRKLFVTIFLLLLPYSVVACSGAVTPTANSEQYEVDPVFREFYSYLGGRETLGDVISPVYEKNGLKYQFSVAGQMIFDPKAPKINQFQLGPLGKKFVVLPPDDKNFPVEGPFKELYESMGGKFFVGKSLTPAIYNESKKRTEQYFENLGFYQGTETGGETRLLPYGAWSCDDNCREEKFSNAIPEMPSPTLSDKDYFQPEATTDVTGSNSGQTTPQPQAAATAVPEAQANAAAVITTTPHQWTMQVTAQDQSIDTDQPQGIAVVVNQDGEPYQGAMPFLIVELPDKSIWHYDFPPTNGQGLAIATIDPISTDTKGTVKYQVCLNGESGDIFCVLQSYTVQPIP